MGNVLNIQHFCLRDGPGVRTAVFFAGCPLRCAWCHNPESRFSVPALAYDAEKCVGCGLCATRCPHGCHTITAKGHRFSRENCVGCGACVNGACQALTLYGHAESADALMAEILADRTLYETSGGGVTLSGGEPLFQIEFALDLLSRCRAEGIGTCVETCGFVPEEHLLRAAAYTDLFLYDWKLTDTAQHRRYTGVGNERILSNLRALDAAGKPVVLRCPIIPKINDNGAHFAGITVLAESLTHLVAVELMPYHSLGTDKYRALSLDYPLGDLPIPDAEQKARWLREISALTAVPVRFG